MRPLLLTNAALEELKRKHREDADFFKQSVVDIKKYETFLYPENVQFDSDYPALAKKTENEPLWETDFGNSLTLYRFFMNKGGSSDPAPISLLFDERYMAYLTHFVYFDYMKDRWPVSGPEQAGRAASQYTFNRAPYARNGILRLFWPAYLIAQAKSTTDIVAFEKKLRFFFQYRLLLDRVLERSFSVNPDLLDLVIRVMMAQPDPKLLTGKSRSGIFPKIIQNILSVTSLDALASDQIAFDILNTAANDVASGKYDAHKSKSYDSNIEDTEEGD